ncbi:MAG: hypothetical protein ACNA8W_03440 [Bradymonadaceae bacterium]
MGGAVLLHTQLLNQAEMLAKKEPRRPKQASLRRSVSASYYAVFHFLIFQATQSLIGTKHDLRGLRQLTARAFNHGEMKSACKSFQSGIGGMPKIIKNVVPPLTVPPQLQLLASHFVWLQEQRHDADYNLFRTFRKRDALSAHERARAVIKDLWPAVKDHDEARFFLLSLLTWKSISNR